MATPTIRILGSSKPVMSETFVKRVFISSLAFLSAAIMFGYGLAVEQFQIWPYEMIHSVYYAAKSLTEFGEFVPENRRVLAPADAPREAITIHDPDRISDGYYIFVGWDTEIMLYAAWLYDNRGERRHTWRIDYNAMDPDGPSNGADSPHAFHVLRDGSIIAGFDKGDVMARLDACGERIWTKDGIFHHSLSRAEDGSFWVWRGEGTAYGHYNYVENFDADTGKKIRELGLIEDIIAGMGSSSVVFGVRPDYPFRRFERDPENLDATDLFHPNDVEVLNSDIAPMFPMFDAGDLLLSFSAPIAISIKL